MGRPVRQSTWHDTPLTEYLRDMTKRPMREPTFLILSVLAQGPAHGYALITETKKLSVSLYVAGLGLAGSVDAGRSTWRVTRKTNCPLRCVSPDLSALGGVTGVDLFHVGGLIRSLPSLWRLWLITVLPRSDTSQVQRRS
jgi:hypothetical protein